jgi:hypothetical protein
MKKTKGRNDINPLLLDAAPSAIADPTKKIIKLRNLKTNIDNSLP